MKHFILDDFLNNLCTVPDEVFSVEEEVLNALELAAENLNNTLTKEQCSLFIDYQFAENSLKTELILTQFKSGFYYGVSLIMELLNIKTETNTNALKTFIKMTKDLKAKKSSFKIVPAGGTGAGGRENPVPPAPESA